MRSLLSGPGLPYNANTIAPGAQTERRGLAGPVRDLPGGETSPAAFVWLLVLCLTAARRAARRVARPEGLRRACQHFRPYQHNRTARPAVPGKAALWPGLQTGPAGLTAGFRLLGDLRSGPWWGQETPPQLAPPRNRRRSLGAGPRAPTALWPGLLPALWLVWSPRHNTAPLCEVHRQPSAEPDCVSQEIGRALVSPRNKGEDSRRQAEPRTLRLRAAYFAPAACAAQLRPAAPTQNPWPPSAAEATLSLAFPVTLRSDGQVI
jgi:hypothetical protein